MIPIVALEQRRSIRFEGILKLVTQPLCRLPKDGPLLGAAMGNMIESESLTVEQILDRWPETARVFVKYHMNCVGCCMDRFETLEQALANYAIPPQVFLNDLNDTIDPYTNTTADLDSFKGQIFSPKA